MDKQSCENHITVLKRVRDVCSSQLDIGALTELDGVIAGLEWALDHRHSAEEVEKLKLRAHHPMTNVCHNADYRRYCLKCTQFQSLNFFCAVGSMPFRVERNDLISSWPERTDGRADA